jgi:hypothetical protein
VSCDHSHSRFHFLYFVVFSVYVIGNRDGARLVDTGAPFHLENMLKDVSKARCCGYPVPLMLTMHYAV